MCRQMPIAPDPSAELLSPSQRFNPSELAPPAATCLVQPRGPEASGLQPPPPSQPSAGLRGRGHPSRLQGVKASGSEGGGRAARCPQAEPEPEQPRPGAWRWYSRLSIRRRAADRPADKSPLPGPSPGLRGRRTLPAALGPPPSGAAEPRMLLWPGPKVLTEEVLGGERVAGGLAALSVGRQSLACILGAEEAGELPLLRLSPPRCVRSLHCVSRGWKASSHLLPGPLPLLAIPDTGSGGRRQGSAGQLAPGAASLPSSLALTQRSLLSCSRRFFTLKSGTSGTPGRASEERADAEGQAPHPPAFRRPMGNRGCKTHRHQGNRSPRNRNAPALLSFLLYQAKFKNATFISDSPQSRHGKKRWCFGTI